MKRFFVVFLLLMTLASCGGFMFIKYLKNRIVDGVDFWSNDVCNLSYESISLDSFTFPMNFRFKIHKVGQSCKMQDVSDVKVRSDDIIVGFNLFDNYLNVDFASDVNVFLTDYVSLCLSLDKVSFVFDKNIFSLLQKNYWLDSMQGISYPFSSLNCNSSDQSMKSEFGLSVKIWDAEPDAKTISVVSDVEIADMSLNIDGSVHFVREKVIGSALNVKNVLFKGPGYSVDLQGDLLLAHADLPYARGKLTLNFDNYPQLLDHLSQLSGQEVDKGSYEEFLQQMKKIANSMDDKNITLILRDEGQNLYLGRAPLSDFFA